MKKIIIMIIVIILAFMQNFSFAENLNNGFQSEVQNINSITSHNNIYIAVGDHGMILVKNNTNSWEKLQQQNENNLNDIEYINGKFFAVGDKGTIIYSEDSINWYSINPFTEKNLFSISSNDEILTLVGDDGVIYTSKDGEIWKKRRLSTGEDLKEVKWYKDRFIAVGKGLLILTSEDGISWKTVNKDPISDKSLNCITYSESQIICAGTDASIYKSENTEQWELVAADIPNVSLAEFKSGVFFNGNFVLTGTNGIILSSNDGMNWNNINSSTLFGIHNVESINEILYGVGRNGTIIYSSDGVNWTNDLKISSDIEEVKLNIGESKTLKAYLEYPWGEKINLDKIGKFEPSDTNIISVDSSQKQNVIKAINAGTAIVKVTYDTKYLEIKVSIWKVAEPTLNMTESPKIIDKSLDTDPNFHIILGILLFIVVIIILILILSKNKQKKKKGKRHN